MTRIAILEGEELGRSRLRKRLRRRAKRVSRKYKRISPSIKASRAAKKLFKRSDLNKYAKKFVGEIIIKYGSNLDEKRVKFLARTAAKTEGVTPPFDEVVAKLAWKIYRTQVRNRLKKGLESPKSYSMSRPKKSKPIRKTNKKARLQQRVRVQRPAPGYPSIQSKGIWQRIKDWFTGK